MKKKSGSIVVEVTVIFMLLMIMIFIVYCGSLGQVKAESEMVNDDMATSELAAFKDIDMDALGKNLNEVVITDYTAAFNTFKIYLKKNLNLGNDFKPTSNMNFIKSEVQIISFIIYNVRGSDIEIIEYKDGNFTESIQRNAIGTIKTPKGYVVKNTTIYTKIKFDINPIFNKIVSITSDEEANIQK